MLAEVLKEADEFAAKYTPVARKILKPKIASENSEEETVKEAVYLDEDSKEFNEAMRKITPELLRLIKDQFQAAPKSLREGAFAEKKTAKLLNTENTEESFDDIIPDEDFSD